MTQPFWRDLKVIVCAGTGGVGKTTIAASLGVWAALEGKRTLVLTIDPALRLAQALGIEGRLEEEVAIEDPRVAGKLFATMINAQSVFDKFVRKAAPDASIAEKLLNNRLYQQLATSLSGSQEFTSLERVLTAAESGQYDLLILDTPPSQNSIDFLRAPDRIISLFQESVTKWFIKPAQERGILAQILSRGTRTVLSALERVTGSQFIRELTDFFQQMAHLQAKVRERSADVKKLLTSSSTGFVLVTGFDELKLQEAMEFQKDLRSQGYRLSAMIVNRCFPDWAFGDEPVGTLADSRTSALREYFLLMRRQFDHRLILADQLSREIGDLPLIKIPEMRTSPQGMDELLQLSQKLKDRSGELK
jgi:anion-transporting  ArsA/GET3 family ATPase